MCVHIFSQIRKSQRPGFPCDTTWLRQELTGSFDLTCFWVTEQMAEREPLNQGLATACCDRVLLQGLCLPLCWLDRGPHLSGESAFNLQRLRGWQQARQRPSLWMSLSPEQRLWEGLAHLCQSRKTRRLPKTGWDFTRDRTKSLLSVKGSPLQTLTR